MVRRNRYRKIEAPEEKWKERRHVRFVHVGSSDCSGLVPFVHEVHHLFIPTHNQLGKIFDIRTQAWVFSNPEIACVLRIQEVAYFLVVDLEDSKPNADPGSKKRCLTSMYETSTVILMFESSDSFFTTRSKSSEQVRGMIPLSGPSTVPMSVLKG
jgi:hypothetical protein